jgi:hypothetical protein
MTPLRITVFPRGKGYIAKSASRLTARGASPEEAAENVRLRSLATFDRDVLPARLLIRIDEPHVHNIILQSIDEPIRHSTAGEEQLQRFLRLVGADVAPEAGA